MRHYHESRFNWTWIGLAVAGFIALGLLLFSRGCGGTSDGTRIEVYGTVELDGQPLKSGRIHLAPAAGVAQGPTAFGRIVDGRYRIPSTDGPAPVMYTIRITTGEPVDFGESRSIVYVPTIDHNRYYMENRDVYAFLPGAARDLELYIERNLETARRAHKLGVRFAMGSDALFTMCGQNARELMWFVKAGMTPEEALLASTANGAELLGVEDRLGKVCPGFIADIVAVDGNPLVDISTLQTGIRWVMKEGVVVVDRR